MAWIFQPFRVLQIRVLGDREDEPVALRRPLSAPWRVPCDTRLRTTPPHMLMFCALQ